mmetsp:Transcript_100721/g.300436  ORF Transcript_100721/g.300436 Transcript_100721/m.300436 type:complete len:216 (-) Transcript_100721:677-1324(-)
MEWLLLRGGHRREALELGRLHHCGPGRALPRHPAVEHRLGLGGALGWAVEEGLERLDEPPEERLEQLPPAAARHEDHPGHPPLQAAAAAHADPRHVQILRGGLLDPGPGFSHHSLLRRLCNHHHRQPQRAVEPRPLQQGAVLSGRQGEDRGPLRGPGAQHVDDVSVRHTGRVVQHHCAGGEADVDHEVVLPALHPDSLIRSDFAPNGCHGRAHHV